MEGKAYFGLAYKVFSWSSCIRKIFCTILLFKQPRLFKFCSVIAVFEATFFPEWTILLILCLNPKFVSLPKVWSKKVRGGLISKLEFE